MKYAPFALLLLLINVQFTFAEKVIGDLNFSQGSWAMVGVPLHNYKLLPIQEELSTFITKDVSFMESIQQEWDLEMTFEDKCDYHYSLKFYRDEKLVRTVKLNLYCGYLTYDGLSYTFDPSEFERFRKHSKEISWSRISFSNLNLLKKAINTLESAKEVYWYDDDIEKYQYPGFYMVSVNGLHWSADLDSLHQAVESGIRSSTRSSDFFLQEYYHLIRGDQLFVRYIVNCDAELARRSSENPYMKWRSHLHNRDSVSILAIGVDRKRYWKLMRD